MMMSCVMGNHVLLYYEAKPKRGEMFVIGRFVDYYSILGIPATATSDEILTALSSAETHLREGGPHAAGTERAILLRRARKVLCDEQHRMMYDIMGKDVTVDEPPAAQPAPRRKLDSERALAGIDEELAKKAEHLQMMDKEKKQKARRVYVYTVIFVTCVVAAYAALSKVLSLFFGP